MCRYEKGQKLLLWRIESERHPHRVVEEVTVTIERFVGIDRHGQGLSLLALDEKRRPFFKTRPYFTPQEFLECRHIWWQFSAESELWVEATIAATYAYPLHYSDGHSHEVKPKGDVTYCQTHHVWHYAAWPCPDRGHKACRESAVSPALVVAG